jgi:hypothetical protein
LGEINRDRLEDDLDESAPPTLYDPRAASTWRIKPVPPKSPGNQRNENGVYEPDVYP